MNLVHDHAISLDRAFKERHQIQSQSIFINNASRQTPPRHLIRSQNPFLILLNRRSHETAMLALVIDAGDVSDDPLLKLSYRHYRLTFRVVLTAFCRRRKSGSGQRMDLFVESAQQPFNVSAVMRRLYRTPFKIDVVFLAGALQHVAAKLSAVISVYALHHAPTRPASRETQLGKPLFLGQDRKGDAQTNRHAVRWFQRDVNTDHHSTEDIDSQSHPGPTDTLPMNVIDQHDIELGVINLNHRERPVSSGKTTGEGIMLFTGGLWPQPLFVSFLFRDSQNPIANRVVVRRLEFCVDEVPSYLISRLLDGTLLFVQVN